MASSKRDQVTRPVFARDGNSWYQADLFPEDDKCLKAGFARIRWGLRGDEAVVRKEDVRDIPEKGQRRSCRDSNAPSKNEDEGKQDQPRNTSARKRKSTKRRAATKSNEKKKRQAVRHTRTTTTNRATPVAGPSAASSSAALVAFLAADEESERLEGGNKSLRDMNEHLKNRVSILLEEKSEMVRKLQKATETVNKLVGEFRCTITQELPVWPSTAEDGFVYEHSAFLEHVKTCTKNRTDLKSPHTNLPMGPGLKPSYQVRNAVRHLRNSGLAN